MASISVSIESDFFNSHAQVQKQNQVFESLRTQLNASSFENLFQKNFSKEYKDSKLSAHANADAQIRSKGGDEDARWADPAISTSKVVRSILDAQPSLHVPAIVQTEIGQFEEQRMNGLPVGPGFNPVVDDASGQNVDSTDGMVRPRLLNSTVYAPGSSSPTIVIGVDGENVRIWMRDLNVESDKDQLISKIRSELSWVGMALDTFVLNGRKLVGTS